MAGDLPKLVRDRIPQVIRDDGDEPVTRRAGEEEMLRLLRDKILEEAQELHESGELEEVADIKEALDRYVDVTGAEEKLEEIRENKAEERGRFDENIVLEGER